jgi:hypothetical protein
MLMYLLTQYKNVKQIVDVESDQSNQDDEMGQIYLLIPQFVRI